jgi:hypothetical protein
VYVCVDCHPDGDAGYDEPFVVVMEEGSAEVEDVITICPRCGSHLGVDEDVRVRLTPVEGKRWPVEER